MATIISKQGYTKAYSGKISYFKAILSNIELVFPFSPSNYSW